MGTNSSEIKSRYFARNPLLQYLGDEDKYLFALEKPKFKFNVIGTGMMGMEHMRVALLEGRATINGIFDTSPRSAIVAYKMLSTLQPDATLTQYGSLEDACNDPEADGLIICTPNFTHIDVIRTAVKSKKHILLEKPMATTLADAHEIVKLSRDYGAVFQVGLQYRFKAIYTEALHEALQRKTLGDIKTLSIAEHRVPFLDKVKQWNKFSAFSGGTLVEKCCHYFDLMNLFSQSKPVEVYATGSQAVNFVDFAYEGKKSDILDNAFVTVVYENGIRANLNLCMFSPMFYEELVLCGDAGHLRTWEREDYLAEGRQKTHLEIKGGEAKPSRISTPTYPQHIYESGHNGATFFEHIAFIDSIEGKRPAAATVDEGFWSIVVGVAAEESVRKHSVVVIDELLKRNGVAP